MTKLDAGLITPLPASDSGSAACWGSKRIKPRPQSCLCLTWSGCPSNDDGNDDECLAFLSTALLCKKDKCAIIVPKVTFLGHVINKDGVKLIFNKIDAINSFPKPTHLRGLLRFLRMIKYYPRFIPDCAKTLRPLNNMLLSKKARKLNYSGMKKPI